MFSAALVVLTLMSLFTTSVLLWMAHRKQTSRRALLRYRCTFEAAEMTAEALEKGRMRGLLEVGAGGIELQSFVRHHDHAPGESIRFELVFSAKERSCSALMESLQNEAGLANLKNRRHRVTKHRDHYGYRPIKALSRMRRAG
jgi:hypothetical protein